MLAASLVSAATARRARPLLAAALLAGLSAAAQPGPAPAPATNGPTLLLWLLLAGLGIVGLMLIMTVGSAASAMRWSAEQAATPAPDAAPVAAEAAPVVAEVAPVAVEAAPVVAQPMPAAVPVYSSEVEEPVLC